MYTSSGELYFSDCEKDEIEICLNCTKPIEECYGDCEFSGAQQRPPSHSIRIKDVTTGDVYNSITEAAQAFGRSIKTICRASKSDTRRVAGHKLIRIQ